MGGRSIGDDGKPIKYYRQSTWESSIVLGEPNAHQSVDTTTDLARALGTVIRDEATRAAYLAYWRRRQDALPTNKIVNNLDPHEIEFYEQFIADGNLVELIPKDAGRPAKSTNDFIWLNNDHIIVELKCVQRAKYDTIAQEIRDAVFKAKRHGVTKDNFIIRIRGGLSTKLDYQLSQYNLRNPENQISRLWVYHVGGLKEVVLI